MERHQANVNEGLSKVAGCARNPLWRCILSKHQSRASESESVREESVCERERSESESESGSESESESESGLAEFPIVLNTSKSIVNF